MYVKSLCFWEGREKPVLSIFTISQQLYFCFYLGTSRLLRGRERMVLHWSTYFGHKISKIRCQKNK